ncbi:hypothetical protein ACS4N0_10040 [Levilactobacillus zymae]|uniref:hypothetical protein n=1 Tax=Levilactobacillus zymae TaxID=267363 RepID=UPI003FCE17CA
MQTKQTVYSQLVTEPTGFSLVNEAGQPDRPLHLYDFASFLSYKNLPTNQAIRDAIATQTQPLTPATAETVAGVDVIVDTTPFTDPARNQEPFNNDYMFVALNCAVRKENYSDEKWRMFHDVQRKPNTFYLAFKTNAPRFREAYITDILKNSLESLASNAKAKFFVDEEQKGTHHLLTDDVTTLATILHEKDVKRFARDQKANARRTTPKPILPVTTVAEFAALIPAYRDTYRKSAALFSRECAIVQPKQLIVFGNDALATMQNMVNDGLFDADPTVQGLIKNALETEHYAAQGKVKGKGMAARYWMAAADTLTAATDRATN